MSSNFIRKVNFPAVQYTFLQNLTEVFQATMFSVLLLLCVGLYVVLVWFFGVMACGTQDIYVTCFEPRLQWGPGLHHAWVTLESFTFDF